MPRRRSQSTRRAVVLGVTAVVVGMAVIVGLALAVGHGSIDVSNLGDKELWVGNADRLAKRVTKDGPLILPDVSPNKKRVVYQPVSIVPRVLVPKVIRHDHRYEPALKDQR